MSETTLNETTCQHTRVEVTSKDLPVSCPTPDMSLWNAHPKVYIPLEDSGKGSCPYCGTEFVLTDHNGASH